MKKALLLLGIGGLLLPASAAQAQTCPPRRTSNAAASTTEPAQALPKLVPAAQALIVLDGFVLPASTMLDQLNTPQIVEVSVLKDGLPTSCRPPQDVVIITSRIPWAVQGPQPRIYATQKAAMRSIRGQAIGGIQLLTVAESARYGAAPGTQLVLLTLKEQPQPRKRLPERQPLVPVGLQ
ncbi:hypothetical protein EJV47_11545 [Hymenobacter gummosus]|uniref:TonB-dependent receptor plug domain-containing protein n=1 Tax=Hymenobacter gummosus TaxID=1776032 RepID=A0A431U430_9BACT|nr:hypothetical protein [Hymenobacter gummosus]RTQ50254.1 hypothetical protein EJV47_11545 [Hymenobacter gummosus]